MDMSLIQEFVQEAREYIDEIEPTLIEINAGATEAGSVDSEMINSIFRLFHSMKGSAGFLSFTTVVAVTHEAETLLDKIRNGKAQLSAQITATLCKALDLFREMLVHIESTGNDEGFKQPAQAMIAVLKKHVAGEPVGEHELDGVASPPEGEEPESAPAPAPADAAPVPPVAAPPATDTAPADAATHDNLSFEALANEPVKQPISAADLNLSESSGAEAAAPASPPPPPAETVPPPSAATPAAEATSEEELAAMQMAPEMRHGFVLEANEQLDSVEQALLLVLDEHADHTEPLNDAFRGIHSFKGNCGFMGLVQMEHLSHTMETLLDGLRNNEISPDEHNVGKLLSLLDVLRGGVDSIESGGIGKIDDLEGHIQALNALLGPKGNVPTSPPVTAPAPPSVVAPTPPSVATPAPPPPPAAASAPPAAAGAPPTGDDMDAKIAAAFAAREQAKATEAAAPAPAPSHAAEHTLAAGGPAGTGAPGAAKSPTAKQDIRVDLHKLDLLINLVGELVIAESMVTRCPAVTHVEDEYYNRAKHQLRRICDDLQDCAMSVRMIPLAATFRKMIRLVHDLATKSNKKIKLNIVGEETEVDKTVIEQIADPLVHIIRNACDHGVGTPEARLKLGKPETGTVTLEGKHEGGEVWITISDDGHGLDHDKILSKALSTGLVGADAKDWPEDRLFKLIFEPGFSTADKITDISGRGVGMDVVKRNIEKLNGRVDIISHAGKGSTFILRIPLTLAIVDAMLVRVGGGKYMIPTLTIRESLVPTMNQVTVTPEGREILRLREEMVPIIRLYDVFACKSDADKLKDGILIVAEDGGRSFAFFVDEIIGQQQTVIKGLPEYIGEAKGFSGCTILGDGTVSLIVDVGAVSQMSGSFHASPVNKAADWTVEANKDMSSAAKEMSFADLETAVASTE